MMIQSNASCECSGYNTSNGNTVYIKMKKAKGHNNKKERKKSENSINRFHLKRTTIKKNPIILTEDLRNVKSVCGPLISPKATI